MLRFLLSLVLGLALLAAVIEFTRPRGATALPGDAAGGFPRTITTIDGEIVIPRRPVRVVSQLVAADDVLLAICPPERIAGIHQFSLDPHYSVTAAAAKRFRDRTVISAESVLAKEPDLIFVASYSLKETVDQLQAASSAPVIRLSKFDTLADLRQNILLVGQAIGEDEAAERLAQEMDRQIEAIVARIPPDAPRPRVLSYAEGGFTAGSGTLFDDILKTLRADNVAGDAGLASFGKIGREQVAAWNPDVIVCGGKPEAQAALQAQLMADPAFANTSAGKTGKIVVLSDAVLLSASQHVTRLLELLATELYGAPQK